MYRVYVILIRICVQYDKDRFHNIWILSAN